MSDASDGMMPKSSTSRVASNTSAESKTKNTHSAIGSSIHILGLALGGPTPRHVDMDWNIPIHQDYTGGSSAINKSIDVGASATAIS